MTRAAIYARVSTREQAEEGFSIDSQLRRLRAYCRSRGWTVTAEYADRGRSGRTENRPEYARMIAEADSWDVLAVVKIDRIHRNACNFYRMCDLLRARGKSFAAIEDKYDSTTAWGRFALDVLARIAQLESERTGERVRMTIRETAKKGIYASQAPFGYRKDVSGRLHVCPEEAVTVRRIYALRTIEKKPRTIAEILNADGIGWKDGTPWTVSRVYAVLRSPTYIGYRYDAWNDIWTRGAWENIIAVEEYAKVNERTPPANGDGL